MFRMAGERICRTRDCFGSMLSRKGSSSDAGLDKIERREERISMYGVIVSGVLIRICEVR